jgi:hypothetical protein
MSANAPPFDPIEATPEEEAEMTAGYLAAWRGQDLPPLAGVAFSHGYRMARNDRAGVVDADQPELARRFLAKQRQIRSSTSEGGPSRG